MLKHNLHGFFNRLLDGCPCGTKSAKSRYFSFYSPVIETVTLRNAYAIGGCGSIIGLDRSGSESLAAFDNVHPHGDLVRLARSKRGQVPLPERPVGCFAQRYLTPF